MGRNSSAKGSPVSSLRDWFWVKFSGGSSNYRLSYIADISLATFFLAWETCVWHSPVQNVVLGRIFGFLVFTLSEYLLHRWAYHHFRGFVKDIHDLHHSEPLGLVATPWFLTAFIALGLWCFFIAVPRHMIFSAVYAGWQAGTIWYGIVHHSHHHWKAKNWWIRKVKVHHLIHHQFPEYNFGISSRFWDSAFGTRYQRLGSQTQFED